MRATIKLKRPIDKIDVSIDENYIMLENGDRLTLDKDKWILSSVKLPDNDDLQIITIVNETGDSRYIYSDVGWYFEKAECWMVHDEWRTDIIAWMPLPKPFKPGEENK